MRGIIIVSGGLDSVTLLYDMLNRGDEVKALSFNYGQRHQTELRQAGLITESLGVQHHVLDMSHYGWLLQNGKSSLLNDDVQVPEGSYAADSMKSTVVPNRNMIMLSIAAGWAVSEEAEYVATAVHAGDHTVYPDCRPQFIESLTKTIKIANDGFIHPGFTIKTPYVNISKTDIARIADNLHVPIHATWSCYKGGMFHCGRCGTCVERLEALHDAGIDDTTIYLDKTYWLEALERNNAE